MPSALDTSQNHGRVRAPAHATEARPTPPQRTMKPPMTAMKSAANGCIA